MKLSGTVINILDWNKTQMYRSFSERHGRAAGPTHNLLSRVFEIIHKLQQQAACQISSAGSQLARLLTAVTAETF